MVRVFEDDHIFAARVCSGQPQRQLVRLAAGVDKKTDAQRIRQKTREALSVAVHVVVEIARIGVEERELLLHGLDHARMTMTNERDVVVNVEKGAARVVVKVLHPSADNFEWVLIRNAEILAEQ